MSLLEMVSATSRLEFDEHSHFLTLYASDGHVVGSWDAYNNIDSKVAAKGFTHLENSTYQMQDKSTPKAHKESGHYGSYGAYGIFRFFVKSHDGIGVHSGKPIPFRNPGPEHATHGCIRTTDEAMEQLVQWAKKEPILTITVRNNGPTHAKGAKAANLQNAVQLRLRP